MKTTSKRWMAAAVCALALSAAAAFAVPAAVPGSINFQACLQDASGHPLAGVQHVAFSIYDAETGGSLIWARMFPVTCTSAGEFSLVLSDSGELVGKPLEEKLLDVFQGTKRWLELEVEGEGKIEPRIEMAVQPFAIQAQYGLWADADFETGGDLAVQDGGMLSAGDAGVQGDVQIAQSMAVSGDVQATDLAVSGTVQASQAGAREPRGLIPVGGIILWNQSTLPTDYGQWAVCDGSTVNGLQTPDLRGLFVAGASTVGGTWAEKGTTGGQAQVTLSIEQMPSHTHSYRIPDNKSQGLWGLYTSQDDGFWRGTTQWASSKAGGGKAHNNLPKYYALYYIMRVK